MDTLIEEIKSLIAEALMLEDMTPQDIGTDQPIFGEGLGLDSIDALELAMAIDRTYGIRMDAESKETRAAFESVRALAEYVHRAKG